MLAVGQYTLELEVIDNDGLSDRTSVVLEVVGQAISEPDPSAPDAQAPTAVIKSRDFTLVDHDGDGTERFRIGGSSSYDNDGNIVAKDWYLDGVYLNSKSTVQPTLSIGTYLLELEVTDNDGLTNRTSVTLEVLPDTSAATAGLSSMPGGNDVLLSSVGVLPVQSVEPFAPIAEHEAIDDQSHQKVSPSVSESSRRPSAAIAALLKTATDAILKHVEDPDAAPAGPSVPLRLANKVDDTQLRPAGLLGLLELSASLTLQEV